MSGRLVALVVVILVFGALSFMALVEVGYLGIFAQHFENYAGMQVLTDLAIVCVLAIVWMVRDAKTSGVTPWPFVVLTLAAGAFGILFYLVAREVKARAAAGGFFLTPLCGFWIASPSARNDGFGERAGRSRSC